MREQSHLPAAQRVLDERVRRQPVDLRDMPGTCPGHVLEVSCAPRPSVAPLRLLMIHRASPIPSSLNGRPLEWLFACRPLAQGTARRRHGRVAEVHPHLRHMCRTCRGRGVDVCSRERCIRTCSREGGMSRREEA